MALAASNYLEQSLLNQILRGQAWSAPSQVYVALYTSDPTDSDSGQEVNGGAYTRQVATFTSPAQISDKAQVANAATIEFPTASGNWGTVTHIGIRDAAVSGNLLLYGQLSTPKTISSGDKLTFMAGDLKITMD